MRLSRGTFYLAGNRNFLLGREQDVIPSPRCQHVPRSVLKENFMPHRTLAAVTLMYKAEGFHPDRNDWYWLQRTAAGAVPAEGRVFPAPLK